MKRTGFYLCGLLLLACLLRASVQSAQAAKTGPYWTEILAQRDPLQLEWLSVPDHTKTLLRSGFDFNDGNYDSGNLLRVEPEGTSFQDPGAAWVLFEASGPGVVTSIWFTGKNRRGQAHIGGRLNFFFDDETEPRVSGDLPGLFTSGDIFRAPLAEGSSGGWVCYSPVFFSRSLKITLTGAAEHYTVRTNGVGKPIPHLYHQFSYQQLIKPVMSSTGKSLAQTKPWERGTGGKVFRKAIEITPGATNQAMSFGGKGVLQNLRLHFEQGDPDSTRIRVSADGAVLIDLAIAEFWGFSRKARPQASFRSALMTLEPDGTYTSYWPMPHRDDLKVELTANAPARLQVECMHRRGWSAREHLPFHAARVTDTTQPGRDIIALAVKGRGHFAGAILELPNGTLEGDDRFYVDGEAFPPAWHGTGTEDYFRCGWYFYGGAITRPLYGLLDNGQPRIAYRFHLADRINFTSSVRIGFEHGHANRYLGPWSGTVFWYGEPES